MDKKTLVLIDGHALAFRSYFALERTGMKTSDKQPTWAVFGFFKAIFDLLKNKDVNFDAIGVAFDVSHKTFRVEKYEEYKANRAAMPDTLRSQMDLIYEGLRAFNIPIYTKEGFEADDVIGTISKKACDLGHNTIILTGDQDAFQLIQKNGCITVLIPSKGELVSYDWQRVHDKLGVYPDQIIDYKALRGDTSDNIPGIRGIGEKTAAKLLTDYQTLDNIYSQLGEMKESSLKTKLVEGEESALLSRFLATIKLDVEVDFDFEKTHVNMPDVQKVVEFLKSMQFYSFLKNLEQILRPFDMTNADLSVEKTVEAVKKAPEPIVYKSSQQQLGFNFLQTETPPSNTAEVAQNSETATICDSVYEKECNIIRTEKELDSLIEELKKQTLISVEAQSVSLEVFDSKLAGLAVAFNENIQSKDGKILLKNGDGITHSYYIPVGHTEGEQLDEKYVLKSLKPILENQKIGKTFQDSKHEVNVFRRAGIKMCCVLFDTMLASYVNDPSRKHDLIGQAIEHLDLIIKDVEDVLYKGKGKGRFTLDELPIETLAQYTCLDAVVLLEMTKFWTNHLDDDAKNLLFNIEIPGALVLADMEYTGVALDLDYLNELSIELEGKLENIEAEIYELAGEKFNVNSPRQVGQILFEKLGIAPKGKKRGAQNFSTDAKVLTELSVEHKIAKCLLEQRHLYKIKNTYVDALPMMMSGFDNKIHTHYNQTSTVTGRLSSSNPNLQNIPIKTELGNRIRKAFVPSDRDNQVLLSSDYSQIELRLLAHISGDKNLISAFKSDADIHSQTASKIFDVPLEEVTKSMRMKAKAVNFGIVYGQTRYGLAGAINITPQEAQTFIDKYFETYPGVKAYMDKAVEDAYQNGYARTMYGRKRYLLDELVSSNHQIKEFAQRAAINSPLQGAAADIIKMAMIELYNKLQEGKFKSKMIMQVHDELVLEVYNDELDEIKKIVKESMELGQPFEVPLLADMEVGQTWMDET